MKYWRFLSYITLFNFGIMFVLYKSIVSHKKSIKTIYYFRSYLKKLEDIQ